MSASLIVATLCSVRRLLSYVQSLRHLAPSLAAGMYLSTLGGLSLGKARFRQKCRSTLRVAAKILANHGISRGIFVAACLNCPCGAH